jgi:DNA polymerase I-like protein with 3'-5' exonuclease and polymerase domains
MVDLFGDVPPTPTRVPNPCQGAEIVPVTAPTVHYQVRKLFTPSVKQLAAYAATQRHKVPQKRDQDFDTGETTERDTFDDEALRSLRVAYAKDPLYPRIEGWRILQKALGTYVAKLQGGSLVGPTGRVHDRFRHTPKTLRLAMELLQVLPRPVRLRHGEILADTDPRRVFDAIRKCFVPAPGHAFVAADFSGIEPLLVAYLAAHATNPSDVSYLRACRLGSHSWFTSNVIGKPVDIMRDSDEDVRGQLDELAKGGPYLVRGTRLPWKQLRDGCKTTHMASLYAGGPGEIARANPDLFKDTKEARYYQDAFFALVPSVPAWHWHVATTVDRDGYLTAKSGFRLYGDAVIDRRWSPAKRTWVARMTRTAKELIASEPQHLGMLYTATATLALERERPDMAQWLRLLIHDEIFGEVPVAQVEAFTHVLTEIMERPHPLLPLWPEASAVMGGDTHLRVAVESKMSTTSWGDM